MITNNKKELFLSYIGKYGYINAEATEELLSRINCVNFEKGHKIIRHGQIATSFFFVVNGMVRAYYSKGDKEVTSWFAYEGQAAVAISSLFDNQPSHETVECIEDCELFYITNNDLKDLFRKYECMNTIGRKMVEEYCTILDDRVYQLQVMSATDRYKDLMTYEPQIVQRAPLSNIASFLGISQETLSRIRHNW